MMKRWPFLFMIAFLGASSCASTSGYVHYVIDADHDFLRASDPKKDLPLRQTCAADPNNKSKCAAMLTPEFYKMETELLELRQALKDCQAGSPIKP